MSVSCDPKDLMESAKCIRTIPQGMRDAVVIYLLCQIAEAGGTGGGSCLVCIGSAASPPNPATCDCSIAYNDQDQFWFWDSVNSVWNPVAL